MSQQPSFNFDNSYVRLSNKLYSKQAPTPVSKPGLIALNAPLADQLGLNSVDLQSDNGLAILAGNNVPPGAEPIATAYAGHQFGNWVPQLGDGRAVLLGEVLDKDGARFDIQLKGSGPTPYSRNGDGRAAVGPVVREYVVSEAMAALGVPTTRALAAVSTGDQVRRETPMPGAVLTRVAQSHIRVGTFQFFAARRDTDSIKLLTDHVIERHYPELSNAENPPLALLSEVLSRQAKLVSKWQSIGFIHGVMNTDNASVAGLTIDYGPCAFMDIYDPATVFSSIDHGSRYAYQNQPGIAQWNMANLAQCLLPLIDDDDDKSLQAAQDVIDSFPQVYAVEYLTSFRKKIGLSTVQDDDAKLITDLLEHMKDAKVDFTNTFRALAQYASDNSESNDNSGIGNAPFFAQANMLEWTDQWQARLEIDANNTASCIELMNKNNPAYIPRNHRIEQIIAAAIQQDYEPMQAMMAVLSDPYNEQLGMDAYAHPPLPDEIVQATFCGT